MCNKFQLLVPHFVLAVFCLTVFQARKLDSCLSSLSAASCRIDFLTTLTTDVQLAEVNICSCDIVMHASKQHGRTGMLCCSNPILQHWVGYGGHLAEFCPPLALQVSVINYQAYAFDGNGSPSSEQDVVDDITSGDASAVSVFGDGNGQLINFGVAPNRPGPESNPPYATSCAGIERIKDIVCPALRDCTKNRCDYSKYWAGGIMVFDFDTELKAGEFTLVNTAYQALDGKCASIKKC